MAAYRRVYDSRHLQADCQEPGSAPKPYDRQSSMGRLSFLYQKPDVRHTSHHLRAKYCDQRIYISIRQLTCRKYRESKFSVHITVWPWLGSKVCCLRLNFAFFSDGVWMKFSG